ncbi:UNVERIFIED_CONTAM: hypothetical protein POZ17_09825 [Ralstonia mannitolilytica]
MDLGKKSRELKDIIKTFDTKWLLGHISNLLMNITSGLAESEIKGLSSPLRQLYYLGGLLVTSKDENVVVYGMDEEYDEIWDKIISLLNEIEKEYEKLFHPSEEDIVNEDWLKIRKVAMPSFLSYFNQGPLDYEEQKINWISDLYSNFDDKLNNELELTTADFINFYNNVDTLLQEKFQGFTGNFKKVKEEWLELTDRKIVFDNQMPEFFRKANEEQFALFQYVQDTGIITRFHKEDLVSDKLSLKKVEKLLDIFSCERKEEDFLYYSSTKPSNPLYKKPIVKVGEDLYQIFEVKQVLHAIEDFLEANCSTTSKSKAKLIEKKGKLLENRISYLFEKLLKKDYKKFESYYVDGNEQDLLYLWKKNAFIIEAKGYNIREPLRDPSKAYVRIKDDFNSSIGYGYEQTHRIEKKFLNGDDLIITDEKGNVVEAIKTTSFQDNDFSIIVNLNSLGQVQNDLSLLLNKDEDGAYPWVIKLDDLEIIILTLLKQKKDANYLVEYLIFREKLHGRLFCNDELEIFGVYLQKLFKEKDIEDDEKIIITTPDSTAIFDELYFKGLGFKDEKYLKEKLDGKHKFL